MKINQEEYLILLYFRFKDVDYVLYTLDDGIKEIYLSKVVYLSKEIHLEKPEKKEQADLKKLMRYFVCQESLSHLREMGYQLLSSDQLKVNQISKKGYQSLELTEKQYDLICQNVNLVFKKENNHWLPFVLFLLLLIMMLIYIFTLY